MPRVFYDFQDGNERRMYLELLALTGALSGLYSDSTTPYLYYRAAEKIFCKAFDVEDLSRADIAVDVSKNRLGLGLKTFLYGNGNTSQKITELNRHAAALRGITGLDLARRVSEIWNHRIQFAMRTYNLERMAYHLVTRAEHSFLLFEEQMIEVDLDSIRVDNVTQKSIRFHDQHQSYSFNFSKSTLFKKFSTPLDEVLSQFQVNILEDPFDFLVRNRDELLLVTGELAEEADYVILPLYSPNSGEVEEKSGLNAWNAAPRRLDGPLRHPNEVYFVLPTWIHREKPDFFGYIPGTNTGDLPHFNVRLPNGDILEMKVVQSGGKGLSSTPLTALGQWILRDVLRVPERQLATRDTLDELGIDSVRLTKIAEGEYTLDFTETGSYEEFESEYLDTEAG